MPQMLIITMREGIEAFLIVAITAAYLRKTGRTALLPLHADEDVMHGDLRDPAVVDQLLTGVDVLVHLAGTSIERPLPEIIENNLVALHQVYEGARRNKVKRIIFASSNHVFGMHSVDSKLALDAPSGLLVHSQPAPGRSVGPESPPQARDRGPMQPHRSASMTAR